MPKDLDRAYSMTSPCKHCPFRNDITPYLHPGRVREIEASLERAEFPCHKTTDSDRDEEQQYHPTGSEIHCAGALILLEKLERPSQMMRICERLQIYDRRKLDMEAPVFDSFDEMVQACEDEEYGQKKRRMKKRGSG
jgi:hypothetical protein